MIVYTLCIIFLKCLHWSTAIDEQCTAELELDYEKCSGTAQMNISNEISYMKECIRNDLCNKLFNISLLEQIPFSNSKYLITKMLIDCCGKCAGFDIEFHLVRMSDMSSLLLNASDIVFPVLASFSSSKVYGIDFTPVLDAPSAYYITLKESPQVEKNLVAACAELWPLMTIALILSVISGFLMWLLETWKNKKEFPRPFYNGIFDGFWWSFISMTTVGYGDKAPVSVLGRLWSVIWIEIGITISSVLTASLTEALTSAKMIKIPEIEGKIVGGLKYHLLTVLMIAQHGGIFHSVENRNLTAGVYELIRSTQSGVIGGFLIDRHIYHHFYHHTSNEDMKRVLDEEMVLTKKFLIGKKLSYGVVMRNSLNYKYFHSYVLNNHMQIEACISFRKNSMKRLKIEKNRTFAVQNSYFFPFLYCSTGVLLGIFIFGFIFELLRRKVVPRSSGKSDPVHNMTEMT